MSLTGQTTVVTGQVLLHLATVYASVVEAISQAVENALDAGAMHVTILLEANRVVISDDGRGMVDRLSEADQVILQAGLSADTRERISPAGRRSLEWMMQYVGYSPKWKEPTRGTKGIGALAAYMYGGCITIRTRPRSDLAASHWQQVPNPVPVFELRPPLRSDLQENRVVYSISSSEEPLRDPWGRVLEHGTVITVSDILEGVIDKLRPALLLQYLQSRFSGDIAKRKVEIVIIDALTEEGKATPGGRELHVQPVSYKGVSLIDETCYLKRGRGAFHAAIRYNPRGRRADNRVTLRWHGGDVAEITSLEGFDCEPWNTGKLTGYVELPDLTHDEFPMNTSKTSPLPSTAFNQWSKRVEALTTKIQNAIEEWEDKAKERATDAYLREAAASVRRALAQTPAFAGIQVGNSPAVETKRNRSGRSKSVRKANPYVVAAVLNEHGGGVADVTIAIYLNGKPVKGASKITWPSGQAYFGKLEPGVYEMRLILPHSFPHKPVGSTIKQFVINSKTPGYRGMFVINTGKPQKRNPIGRIQIWFRELETGRLYNERLQFGLLELNILHPTIAEALAGNDRRRLDVIVATCVASAIAEYALEGETAFVLEQTTELALAIHSELSVKR